MKFRSKKEYQLWVCSGAVVLAIFSTLFFGGRLINFMVDHRIIEQSALYLFLIMLLIFAISGWNSSRRKLDYWIYAGVLLVYGMTLIRMDFSIAERSHMFEYGLLSILIYAALTERKLNGGRITKAALFAILGAGTIGLLDECIQYFLSYRVFDPMDIAFNYFASTLGIFTSMGVTNLKRIIKNRKN